MKSAVFVLLLSAVFECNGHLKLGGLLSEAHKHVHSTVEGVAGTILGGLNFNFQGQVGGNKHQRPPPPPQPNGEQETVVVVVEEQDNNYRPHQPGYGHNNNRPGYNNQNQGQWNGNPHGNHHHNPYGNGQSQYGNQYGHQNQHGHQNQYGPNHDRPGGRPERPNQNYGQNNYQRPEQTTQGYNNNGGYNNGGYNNGEHNNGGYNNGGQNNGGYNNGGQSNGGYNNDGYNGFNNNNQGNQRPNQGPYEQQTDPTPNNRPTYGTVQEIPTAPPTFPHTTKKPVDKDEPLFVPLNPNEYQYGGDKINISGPKRETDNNDASPDNEDDDVPIDVRIQSK